MDFFVDSDTIPKDEQDFGVPAARLTRSQGIFARSRIGFGSLAPGTMAIRRVFSAVTSRRDVDNANHLIATADDFHGTGDAAWFSRSRPKLPLAPKFMFAEFPAREAKLIRTPWIGHDGPGGCKDLDDGIRVISSFGVGIGGELPGQVALGRRRRPGDDDLPSPRLTRMADLEALVAANAGTSRNGPLKCAVHRPKAKNS